MPAVLRPGFENRRGPRAKNRLCSKINSLRIWIKNDGQQDDDKGKSARFAAISPRLRRETGGRAEIALCSPCATRAAEGIVPDHALMKKGLRRTLASQPLVGLGVPDHALMKKGLRLVETRKLTGGKKRSGPCPDEEGIETLNQLNSPVTLISSGPCPDEEGIETSSLCSVIRAQRSSGPCPDEEGIETPSYYEGYFVFKFRTMP